VRGVFLILVLAGACGSVSRPFNDDARPPEDASSPGDSSTPDDASDAPDAEPPLPPTPGRELVGAAGRVKSATFTLDVQVGHPISLQPATSSTYRLEASTVLKP
jgi:hypothetical protein